MAAQNKTTIKALFETGDRPTQANFGDLIDSYQDYDETLDAVVSAVQGGGTGVINVVSSGAVSMVTPGAVGLTTLEAVTTASAQSGLGLLIGTDVQAYDEDILKADTSDRIVANMGFTPVSDSSSSGAVTFDFSTGNICKITLTENITSITLSGAAAGDTLKMWITAAGSYTVSGWPAAVKWAGNTAPTMSSTAGAVDIITLEYDGTNYYGAYTQDHR